MTKMVNDTGSIHELFTKLFSAWNNGDGIEYANCFTEDVDYVTFMGHHLKGKKEVEVSHQALFNSMLKGSKIEGRITDIRFLSSNLAIVHCIGNTIMRWQKKAPKNRESINTNVLMKQNGLWKITSFHNCRIQKTNWFIKILEKVKIHLIKTPSQS